MWHKGTQGGGGTGSSALRCGTKQHAEQPKTAPPQQHRQQVAMAAAACANPCGRAPAAGRGAARGRMECGPAGKAPPGGAGAARSPGNWVACSIISLSFLLQGGVRGGERDGWRTNMLWVYALHVLIICRVA